MSSSSRARTIGVDPVELAERVRRIVPYPGLSSGELRAWLLRSGFAAVVGEGRLIPTELGLEVGACLTV